MLPARMHESLLAGAGLGSAPLADGNVGGAPPLVHALCTVCGPYAHRMHTGQIGAHTVRIRCPHGMHMVGMALTTGKPPGSGTGWIEGYYLTAVWF